MPSVLPAVAFQFCAFRGFNQGHQAHRVPFKRMPIDLSAHLLFRGDEAEPHVLAGGNPTHVVGDLNELQAAVGHHSIGGGAADSGPINEILDAVAETSYCGAPACFCRAALAGGGNVFSQSPLSR